MGFDQTVTQHELHRVERGGEVTYHCPGQVVVYPIINLNFYKRDLHWYLRQLEEVIIRVLARYNIEADRDGDHTGVWTTDGKIAAIGINVARWLTMHGLALNVNCDLSGFSRIVPCGIEDRSVASLQQVIASGAEQSRNSRDDGCGTSTPPPRHHL